MRVWPTLTQEQQKEMVSNEESIVYSQAIHYAYRMVYLRVPLDASKSLKEGGVIQEGESSNSNITNRSAAGINAQCLGPSLAFIPSSR